MNCLPYISTGVLLLAMFAGTYLLVKANKEGLNNYFKGVAYFIMVSAFLALACCWVRTAFHCGNNGGCGNMGGGIQCCQMGNSGMFMGGCSHQWMGGCSHGKSCCGKKQCKGKCKHDDDDDDDEMEMGGHRCGGKHMMNMKEWDEAAKDTTAKK